MIKIPSQKLSNGKSDKNLHILFWVFLKIINIWLQYSSNFLLSIRHLIV